MVTQIQVEVYKNPNLGFSIAGGVGTTSNPFHPNDNKVCRNLAAIVLVSGYKQKRGRAKDKGKCRHASSPAVSLVSTDSKEPGTGTCF